MTVLGENLEGSPLNDLAHAIDLASDLGDVAELRQLGKECERRLVFAEGEDRVLLQYYQSNTYSAIITTKQHDMEYIWSWEHPDAIQNVLLLRRAILEPAFENIDPIIACQIRTNLANQLNSLGRPIAANEQWLIVLDAEPRFAKALANRALSVAFYAGNLYDHNHTSILLAAARSLFDEALDENAIWESGDRNSISPDLVKKRQEVQNHLISVSYDEGFDLNQWSLGSTEEERSYRHWCLRECLFLNPLNEAYSDSVAATDVLHLPSHTYSVHDVPRFPTYFNLLKQEYISARYRLYCAIHRSRPTFLMRDVLMLDGGVNQALGHYTEDLRSAFRSSYSLFDKIGLFLNDYFQIGLKPREVTFRGVWSERTKNGVFRIRPMFKGRHNWPLRGLYFLSKDLFDVEFKEVSQPDAANLAKLRQQIEHRFLSFQHHKVGESTEIHELMSIGDFQDRTLRLLKMAREALIYVSLAMHCEEVNRQDGPNRGTKFTIQSKQLPFDSFE